MYQRETFFRFTSRLRGKGIKIDGKCSRVLRSSREQCEGFFRTGESEISLTGEVMLFSQEAIVLSMNAPKIGRFGRDVGKKRFYPAIDRQGFEKITAIFKRSRPVSTAGAAWLQSRQGETGAANVPGGSIARCSSARHGVGRTVVSRSPSPPQPGRA